MYFIWYSNSQSILSGVTLYNGLTIHRYVLDIGKVANKSNEIPLVQQMIKDSDLQQVIFTFDALHCQKKQPKSL